MERLPVLKHEPEYIPFSPNPEVVNISGHNVYEYLSEEKVDGIIDTLAEQIDFDDFDAVIVNMNGGKYLFEKLKDKKGFTGKSFDVEYHRPADGVGTDVVIPVPKELYGKKCLIIDDISDRGDTFISILEKLSPESVCIALVSKKDIEGKKDVPNLLIGVVIDGYVWIGGCGMDIGFDDENNEFRNYGGIVVKIPKKVTREGRWIY